jgi:hypothetical protein
MSKNELEKIFTNALTGSYKEKVLNLEKTLISMADGVNIIGDGKNVVYSDTCPIKHSFVEGIYVREMKMKQGLLLVGCIHKHSHVWFLLDGKIAIATENGMKEYEGPVYIITGPGIKRAGLVIEDCTFVNIHANPSNTQDLKKLEDSLIAFSYEEYEEYTKNKNKMKETLTKNI